jgi:hypothetical protein
MVDVSAEHARDRRGRQELDGLATIISASKARFAGTAGNVGFDGDSVANLEMADRRVHGNNLAGRLVTQDVVSLDNHGTDAASMPEVDIGTADTGASNSNTNLALLQVRAGLDSFGRGLSRSNPEVMIGVGINANIGLESGLDVHNSVTFYC